MFWKCLCAGIVVLSHWQTYVAGLLLYVAGLLFVFLSMATMRVTREINTRFNRKYGAAPGTLAGSLRLFVHVWAIIVFVTSMSPIILGLSHHAAWSLPWAMLTARPWHVALATCGFFVGAIGLQLVPALERLTSLRTLLIGGTVLVFTIGFVGASL